MTPDWATKSQVNDTAALRHGCRVLPNLSWQISELPSLTLECAPLRSQGGHKAIPGAQRWSGFWEGRFTGSPFLTRLWTMVPGRGVEPRWPEGRRSARQRRWKGN